MTNPSKFRTPMKQVKGLGSAKDGTGHWIAQRISAILIAPLGLIIVIWLALNHGLSYSEMIKFVGSVWVAMVVFLFVASASYHGALGLQVIIEDYVHSPFWKYWLLLKARLTGYILPVITLFILIKIMLIGLK